MEGEEEVIRGGRNKSKQATSEIQDLVLSLKSEIEQQMGCAYGIFEAQTYTIKRLLDPITKITK